MRKSLGSKRQFVSEIDQDDIVRMYGDFQTSKKSKIFPNEAFGYRRITVERPLKLNFQASEERIARIQDENAIQKLSTDAQNSLIAACQSLNSETLYLNRKQFQKDLKSALSQHDVSLSAPQ